MEVCVEGGGLQSFVSFNWHNDAMSLVMCYYLNVSGKKVNQNSKNKKLKIKGSLLGRAYEWHFALYFVILMNLAIQIYRKPAELLSVFCTLGAKTIIQTWNDYKDEFQQSSTHLVSPFL